jgi:hypothetical protein
MCLSSMRVFSWFFLCWNVFCMAGGMGCIWVNMWVNVLSVLVLFH